YTTVFALNRFGESLDHPTYIHLCSEWATPQDRGMMLGLFQVGNSLGRSIFSIFQGYLYDWNLQTSWFLAMVWPTIGFMCILLAAVPTQAHKREQARRAKAAEQTSDTPIEAVPV
ncbi:major facilitator superfamily protein, partial [Kipferlia bialata]